MPFHCSNLQQWSEGTELMDQLKVSYKIARRYPKIFYLRLLFGLLDIAFVNSFIIFTKYMEKHFPHSRRVKP